MADYPFTTVEPVLGTLERDERQLVLADIPGLIEGASAGAGLGHEFLAHVERCRLLVHVLDLAPFDGSDPAENHATVEAELRLHGHGLAELPRILALSKADLVPEETIARGRSGVERALRDSDVRAVIPTSAATGAGLDELAARSSSTCRRPSAAPTEDAETPATHRVYRPGRGDAFRVERAPSGAFRVDGRAASSA